jgi:hypothetical protein
MQLKKSTLEYQRPDRQNDFIKNSRTVSTDRPRRTTGALAEPAALRRTVRFFPLCRVSQTCSRGFTWAHTIALAAAGLVAARPPCAAPRGAASEIVITALDAIAIALTFDVCGGVDPRSLLAMSTRSPPVSGGPRRGRMVLDLAVRGVRGSRAKLGPN